MLAARDLWKAYGAKTAVAGISLDANAGRDRGAPRPQRRGQVDHGRDALRPRAARPRRRSRVGGVPVGDDASPVKRRIGLVPQDISLYEDLSGARQPRALRRALRRDGRGSCASASPRRSSWSASPTARRTSPPTFSGGMKRRLNIACALVHDPDVLLLDEPTVGVDPQSRNAIFDNLETLRARGKALIYTTHYMEEAERLCDRIVIIDHGKVVASDRKEALLTCSCRPRSARKTVVREASLEDVFLHLTGRAAAGLTMNALIALVRKDLVLYFSNKRALMITLAAPILIAAFFGAVMGGPPKKPTRVPVAVVDLDASPVSKAIVASMKRRRNVRPGGDRPSPRPSTLVRDRQGARGGGDPRGLRRRRAARDLPARREASPRSSSTTIPRRRSRFAMVKGLAAPQHVDATSHREPRSRARWATRERFSTMPFIDAASRAEVTSSGASPIASTTATRTPSPAWACSSSSSWGSRSAWACCSCAGWGCGSGCAPRRYRARCCWEAASSRGRSSRRSCWPASTPRRSRSSACGSRAASWASSLVAIAFAVLTSTFGLLIAALGKTPEATRGLAILATLLLVMLGGAWVPTFVFPEWLQTATLVVPTRWAVDGLEAMTWRGLGFEAALGACRGDARLQRALRVDRDQALRLGGVRA